MKGQARIVELTIFGLTGLAAMLVVAFCLLNADELSVLWQQSSFDPGNNARPSDSPAIKAETWSPAFSRGQVEAIHG